MTYICWHHHLVFLIGSNTKRLKNPTPLKNISFYESFFLSFCHFNLSIISILQHNNMNLNSNIMVFETCLSGEFKDGVTKIMKKMDKENLLSLISSSVFKTVVVVHYQKNP
ncbi:hypothetical protein ACTFIR_012839 [Dictyostelium discoideum]